MKISVMTCMSSHTRVFMTRNGISNCFCLDSLRMRPVFRNTFFTGLEKVTIPTGLIQIFPVPLFNLHSRKKRKYSGLTKSSFPPIFNPSSFQTFPFPVLTSPKSTVHLEKIYLVLLSVLHL